MGQTIKGWEAYKKAKKTVTYTISMPDGRLFELELQAVSKGQLEEIMTKYEELKNDIPQPMEAERKGNTSRLVPKKYGTDYENYLKEIKKLEELQGCEMVLLFLVEKPCETFEENVKFLNDVLVGGHFNKILEIGMQISSYGKSELNEDEVNEIKNS